MYGSLVSAVLKHRTQHATCNDCGVDIWDLLGALVAPISALAGALGGVALTNRHAARIEIAKARRDDRSAARDMLFDFIRTGQEWSTQGITQTMSAVAAVKDGRSTLDDPPRSDMLSYNLARQAHAEAGAKVRLFIGDADVRAIVVSLKEKSDLATDVLSPIFSSLLDGQAGANRVTSSQVHALFNFFEGYAKSLGEFESTAEVLVAEKIRVPKKWWSRASVAL